MRQLIIARKDLNMSPGKLAAQCCHASLAFITRHVSISENELESKRENVTLQFVTNYDVYDKWINDIFTKTICEAKNLNHLLKAKKIAEELGLVEGRDFYLIKDRCLTELTPEEVDDEGIGRVTTCIGFKPLDDEIAHKISKKFQLYK